MNVYIHLSGGISRKSSTTGKLVGGITLRYASVMACISSLSRISRLLINI